MSRYSHPLWFPQMALQTHIVLPIASWQTLNQGMGGGGEKEETI